MLKNSSRFLIWSSLYRAIFIVLLSLFTGLLIGFYFGFDLGFEKAVKQTKPEWKTFTNEIGKYSISYPSNFIFNEGKSISPGGQEIKQAEGFIQLISPETEDGYFTLSVNSFETESTDPRELVDTLGCANPSGGSVEPVPFNLDRVDGFIFENIECSGTDFTVISVIKDGRYYGIGVGGNMDYDTVKPRYKKILTTFKFEE